MVRVFITGSSDGIGQAAAVRLASSGHEVVLHARNDARAAEAKAAVPQAHAVLVGDLRSLAATRQLARAADDLAPFDAIVHNAGIGYGSTASRAMTDDGVSAVFAVNTLAPYVLACAMRRPTRRLLIMSSDSHYGGDETLRGAQHSHSYADSKLHEVMLAKALARRWAGDVQVLSMHPGWVRTKMGGRAAPGGLDTPARALAEWATGSGVLAAAASGAFVTTNGEAKPHPGAASVERQEVLVKLCRDISGLSMPGDEGE